MSEKRRVLGRGLGALIPTSFGEAERRPPDAVVPGSTVDAARDAMAAFSGAAAEESSNPEPEAAAWIGVAGGAGALRSIPGLSLGLLPTQAIKPNARQPRIAFDEDDLAELARSITLVGVLQPVVVREIATAELDGTVRYELVVGERRWRAAALAGLTHLPAILKGTADDHMLRDALVENLHRSQLNPLEEAAAYDQLLTEFSLRHDELADRVGKSRSHVTNTLRLMRLPATVARRVAAGVLSAGHARALLAIEEPEAMERLAQRIVAEGLSVRAVEEIIAVKGHGESAERRSRRAIEQPPELTALATRLGDALETRVQISVGQRKGRLTVDFAGMDDLGRILDALGLTAGRLDDSLSGPSAEPAELSISLTGSQTSVSARAG